MFKKNYFIVFGKCNKETEMDKSKMNGIKNKIPMQQCSPMGHTVFTS